ncbi:hypothetical protein [Nibribacter koreensis]|uniref:hypothetical protein n=1 Tax=Nibribacter koreensis TaxID=1084519 RepID=UPI0031EAF6FE
MLRAHSQGCPAQGRSAGGLLVETWQCLYALARYCRDNGTALSLTHCLAHSIFNLFPRKQAENGSALLNYQVEQGASIT